MVGVYLTEAQFAARFHRAPRTVRRWRVEGSGPPFIRIGRQVVISETDADAWAAARTFTSNADEIARKRLQQQGGVDGGV